MISIINVRTYLIRWGKSQRTIGMYDIVMVALKKKFKSTYGYSRKKIIKQEN